MEELFKDKYRIKSTRLKDWDYSQEGYYYITICTKDREPYFGRIKNGEIVLSNVGRIVQNEWLKTPQIRTNIEIDEFIIMPEHFHGIIIIDDKSPVETPRFHNVETPRRDVSTSTKHINHITNNEQQTHTTTQGVSTGMHHNPNHKSQWKPNSIGSIICQFKSVCTKEIRRIGYFNFKWQTRFYDHIIRDEKDLNRIRKYIRENPLEGH